MQEEILHKYCDNDMRELKKICNMLMRGIGGISNKDYDDFYSIGLEALYDSSKRFDESKSQFKTFLIGNIKRKFKTEMRDRNRGKRIPAKQIQSMSTMITDDGLELGDLIESDFNVYNECFGEDLSDIRINTYLSKLSTLQQIIVKRLSEGYCSNEIKEQLHISNEEYNENLSFIQAYENVKLLMQIA